MRGYFLFVVGGIEDDDGIPLIPFDNLGDLPLLISVADVNVVPGHQAFEVVFLNQVEIHINFQL
jgi:hypothetical protein